jgi:hypothetical protein
MVFSYSTEIGIFTNLMAIKSNNRWASFLIVEEAHWFFIMEHV